jgi:hypothetical protein
MANQIPPWKGYPRASRSFPRIAGLGNEIENDWILQISQGYVIRILQHFATKLRNITNFVMIFQAAIKFLSRLV